MKASDLANKILAIAEKQTKAKNVNVKIFVTEDKDKDVLIYADSIKHDQLQIGGFNTFRKNVNVLTSYFNGVNIQGLPIRMEIGEYSLKFTGGKFSDNTNNLFNSLVARNGGFMMKKEIAKEIKETIVDNFLPEGSSILHFLSLCTAVEGLTLDVINGAASLITYDSVSKKLIAKDLPKAVETEETKAVEAKTKTEKV